MSSDDNALASQAAIAASPIAGACKSPVIMFIAGENSGDLHGAKLISELKKLFPDSDFFGFGGDRMERAGMHLVENLAQKLPIIGATQVIKNIGKIRALLRLAAQLLEARKPDVLVLIDYPGFNLRTSKVARKLDIPVIYYISPQVWAWHKSRLEIIRQNVSKMLVILPFEADMYDREKIPAVFVGHPLQDTEIDEIDWKTSAVQSTCSRQLVRESIGASEEDTVIGLIPGSRESEIIRHLPVMLGAARIIQQRIPRSRFVLPKATTVPDSLLKKYLDRFSDVKVLVSDKGHQDLRSAMDFAICKSGTSTLEFAIQEIPMVIIYKASWLTGVIARRMVKIPFLGLVNIVAQEEVAPEILQQDATPGNIAERVIALLKSPEKLGEMRRGLAEVKAKLGGPGASKRAATEIAEVIREKRINSKSLTQQT